MADPVPDTPRPKAEGDAARPDTTAGPWEAYFTIHGDPMVVPSSAPYPTSRIADVSTAPPDYGRANALLIATAPDLLDEAVELRAFVRAVDRWIAESDEARNRDGNKHIHAIAPLESAERIVVIARHFLGKKFSHLNEGEVSARRG